MPMMHQAPSTLPSQPAVRVDGLPVTEQWLGGGEGWVVASDAPVGLITLAEIAKLFWGARVQLCDGVADQTEFNACLAVTNKVNASAGHFATSGTIDASGVGGVGGKDGVALIGAGGGQYGIGGDWAGEGPTVITYSGSGIAILVGSNNVVPRPGMVKFQDFSLKGNANATKGIHVNDAGPVNFFHVAISGFTKTTSYAIDIDYDTAALAIRECNINANHHGVRVASEANGCGIYESIIAYNAGVGVTLAPGTIGATVPLGFNIDHCVLGNNAGDNLHIDVGIYANISHCNFFFSDAGSADRLSIRVGDPGNIKELRTIRLTNCYFKGEELTNHAIGFATGALFDYLVMTNCSFERFLVAGVDNSNLAPLTTAPGCWIIDVAGNTAYASTATAITSVFAVDGVAGGVIRPTQREQFVADLLRLCGTNAFIYVPGRADTTTSVARGQTNRTITWSESLQTMATHPTPLGNGVAIDLNGTDEDGTLPDSDYFSLGDGITPVAGTFFALIRPDTISDETIFVKRDDTTGLTLSEFTFELDGAGRFSAVLYDDSVPANIGRRYSVAVTAGKWVLLVATMAAGTTDAAVKTYHFDGTVKGQVDDTNLGSGIFVAVENLATVPRIGSLLGAAGTPTKYFNGKIGLLGFINGTEFTADQVYQLAFLVSAWSGLGII